MPQVRCGLKSSHNLGKHGEPTFVKERYLEAIHRIRKDFHISYAVCSGCYDAFKRGCLERHLAKKKKVASVIGSSITLSQTNFGSTTSEGRHLQVLTQTSLDNTNNSRQQASLKSSTAKKSQSSLVSNGGTYVLTPSPTTVNIANNSRQLTTLDSFNANGPLNLPTRTQSGVSNASSTESRRSRTVAPNESSDRPSTSSEAAAQRAAAALKNGGGPIRFNLAHTQNAPKRTRAQMIQDAIDDRSPSATDGTRLPNVQPAPKRRHYVTANKDVMDIYLAGTTGG